MAGLAVMGVMGLGLDAYSQVQAGNAKAAAARQDAGAKRQQALEVEAAGQAQQRQTLERSGEVLGDQQAGYAANGVGAGSSTLLAMEQTLHRRNQQVMDIQRAADFRASQLRTGADWEEANGQQIGTASDISAGGTLLTGAANIAKAYGAFNSTPTVKVGGG